MNIAEAEIVINERMVKVALEDPEKSAKAVNLVYMTDHAPGFRRVRKGKSFYYLDGESRLQDPGQLERISKLVIPPAWEEVWICKHEKGHLQVTGLDTRKRKQYRYHTLWSAIRSQTKFYRLLEFGRQLPAMRLVMESHLAEKQYTKLKVLALVVSIMEKTCIRIGNSSYEKLYGSFGLTTLKNKHADIRGSAVVFSFKGKKGIQQNISLQSRKLARLVKACQEIPGKELFEFIDEEGHIHKVDSGMVNDYIRELSGCDFTAKDFRTWGGSLLALKSLQKIGGFDTDTQMKHNILQVLDEVALGLGNTRTVCRKYYVHPVILKLYEEKKLGIYLDSMNNDDTDAQPGALDPVERTLIKILEDN